MHHPARLNPFLPAGKKLSTRSSASRLFIFSFCTHSLLFIPPHRITELLMCQKQSDFFAWCVLPVLSSGHRGLRAQISDIKKDICRVSWRVMGFMERHRWAVRKIGDEGKKRKSLLFLLSPTEPCSMNFTESEGNIEIQQHVDRGVECTYLITVYLGYGIEVQVSAGHFIVRLSKTSLVFYSRFQKLHQSLWLKCLTLLQVALQVQKRKNTSDLTESWTIFVICNKAVTWTSVKCAYSVWFVTLQYFYVGCSFLMMTKLMPLTKRSAISN